MTYRENKECKSVNADLTSAFTSVSSDTADVFPRGPADTRCVLSHEKGRKIPAGDEFGGLCTCACRSNVTMEKQRFSRKYCCWRLSKAPPTRKAIMLGLLRSSVAQKSWTVPRHMMQTKRTCEQRRGEIRPVGSGHTTSPPI